LPVEANVDYVRHSKAQRMIAGMTPGTVLVLPLDEKLNYLAPLTTVHHFYPLLNGVSGHLPPSNGLIFQALRAQDWGRRQADLLRVLDVRYIVIDHRNPASTPDADVKLQRFLDDNAFVSDRLTSPVEGLSVVNIGRPEDGGVSAGPGLGTFEYTHTTQRGPQGAEAFVRISRTAAPILTSREGREMEIEITAYDQQGDRLWATRMCRRLPDLWLRGQIVEVPIKIPSPRERSTARLTIQLRQAHLGVEHQLEIMLP
jgi:hypothetical protein